MPQNGFLVIADISGYSTYVNQTELDHAQDSLSALLELLLKHTRSPLVVSKLEGDAVLSYAPQGSFLQGQTLVEMLEATYAAFRKSLELMVINTTCPCAACRDLPGLDLKFFIHCGTFTLQKVGPYTELLGNDVNLLHRLLKNSIGEKLGLRAYTALTESAVGLLGLDEHCASLPRHTETYDIGPVTVCVKDMHAVWERWKDKLRLGAFPENALGAFTHDYPIPQALMWDYITRPQTRGLILKSDRMDTDGFTNGLIDEGTTYYCHHKDGVSIQTIIDWEPVEQYTTQEPLPWPDTTMRITYRLTPIEGGTRFTTMLAQVNTPEELRAEVMQFMTGDGVAMIPGGLQALEDQIRRDLADGRAQVSAPAIQFPSELIAEAAKVGVAGG